MEKKHSKTSNSSVCWKIRQALSTNPAFQAIYRFKQHSQKPKPITAQPPQTQHKVITSEGEGPIPIKFDFSTPKVNNGNSSATSMISQPQVTKVVSPQVGRIPERTVKQNQNPVVHSEQQGKKVLDLNDAFAEYIRRTKYRIRTISNVGKGQSNSASDEGNGSGGVNRMEIEKDHFSDFILSAKKNIRTSSNLGKTSSSLKRG